MPWYTFHWHQGLCEDNPWRKFTALNRDNFLHLRLETRGRMKQTGKGFV